MKNLSNEILQKAKECKTVGELLTLAKENDFPLTEQQATEKFNEWNKTGELADAELCNVSGGGCLSLNEVYVGQNVGLWTAGTAYCETCDSERYIIEKIVKHYIHLRCVNGCANMYDNRPIRIVAITEMWITD